MKKIRVFYALFALFAIAGMLLLIYYSLLNHNNFVKEYNQAVADYENEGYVCCDVELTAGVRTQYHSMILKDELQAYINKNAGSVTFKEIQRDVEHPDHILVMERTVNAENIKSIDIVN